jgi:hypothetical protein
MDIGNRVRGGGSNLGKCKLLSKTEKICNLKQFPVISGNLHSTYDSREKLNAQYVVWVEQAKRTGIASGSREWSINQRILETRGGQVLPC